MKGNFKGTIEQVKRFSEWLALQIASTRGDRMEHQLISTEFAGLNPNSNTLPFHSLDNSGADLTRVC